MLVFVTEMSGQWLDDYCYRKQITINASQVSGTANHSDFPVLINIGLDNDLRTIGNGGYVYDANGLDLVFSIDHSAILDYDIEEYNPATGEFIAWVKVPTLDYDDNTFLYLYFGNDAPVDYTSNNTWSNGYVSVYHLHDDYLDAAGGGNNGTPNSVGDPIGRIGDGSRFNSGTDYIQIGTSGWSTASGTIELWASSSGNVAGNDYIFGHTTIPEWNNRFQLYTNNDSFLDIGLGDNHLLGTQIQDLGTFSWNHIVLNWDGTNYELFINGISRLSGTYSGLAALNPLATIGNNGSSNLNSSFNGIIDEVRISTAVRTIDWVATEYSNQNNPSGFYTTGGREQAPLNANAGSAGKSGC